MSQLLSDPQALVVICLLIGFVLSINLTLLGLLRGDKRVQSEAAKWARAVGGGRAGQRRQSSQYDELRRVVAALEAPPASEPPPDLPPGPSNE